MNQMRCIQSNRRWLVSFPGLFLVLCLLPLAPLHAYARESLSAEGLRFGVAIEGLPDHPDQLLHIEQETKLPLSLVNIFLQWPTTPELPEQQRVGEFPLPTAMTVASHGAILCITWEPMYIEDGEEQVIPAQGILQGEWDAYIRRFARAAAEWGGDCILRFGHEMNILRYHWGVSREEYGPKSPGVFVEMFRYVRRVFLEESAHNVRFAFCPNAESLPSPIWSDDGGWNTIAAWFPGQEYVDVLGLDGYNWGTTQTVNEHGWQSNWRSFEDIFGSARQELQSLEPEKPLYIFETSSAVDGGDKAIWLADMALVLQKWGVAGVVWFQVNKEVDWRLMTGIHDKDLTPLQVLLGTVGD